MLYIMLDKPLFLMWDTKVLYHPLVRNSSSLMHRHVMLWGHTNKCRSNNYNINMSINNQKVIFDPNSHLLDFLKWTDCFS
jgi:hypothetical protein